MGSHGDVWLRCSWCAKRGKCLWDLPPDVPPLTDCDGIGQLCDACLAVLIHGPSPAISRLMRGASQALSSDASQLAHSSAESLVSVSNASASQVLCSDASQLADSTTCYPCEVPFRRFAFHCVIDPADTTTWPIVYKGKEYQGIASKHPVFVPPPTFLVIDPTWIQCACVHGCCVCVYDGATLCTGCQTWPCHCGPGCCDILPDSSDSSGDEHIDASQLADSNAETLLCDCGLTKTLCLALMHRRAST